MNVKNFKKKKTFRAHTKRAEDRMLRFKYLKRRNFRAPAPAPQRDLFFVGGVPALKLGWPFDDRAGTPLLAGGTLL